VVGAIAAFVLLILLGFNIEALVAIGALVVFVALIFLLVRGPTPLFEIVTHEDEEARAGYPSQIKEAQSLAIPESIPDIDEQPSDNLKEPWDRSRGNCTTWKDSSLRKQRTADGRPKMSRGLRMSLLRTEPS
jgi:hypothetical protein